jgi:hypothetical protein
VVVVIELIQSIMPDTSGLSPTRTAVQLDRRLDSETPPRHTSLDMIRQFPAGAQKFPRILETLATDKPIR